MVCGTPRFIYGDKEYISGGLPALRGYFSELSKIHQVRFSLNAPTSFCEPLFVKKISSPATTNTIRFYLEQNGKTERIPPVKNWSHRAQ